jgi:hypothetical protein
LVTTSSMLLNGLDMTADYVAVGRHTVKSRHGGGQTLHGETMSWGEYDVVRRDTDIVDMSGDNSPPLV